MSQRRLFSAKVS